MSARVTRGGVAAIDRDKPKSRCRRWMLSCRVDGTRKMRRFNGTYREACAELDDWRAQLAEQVAESETLGAYAQKWADWRAGSVSASTREMDGYIVRTVERSPLAYKRMDDITPADIRDGLTWIRDNPANGGRLSQTTMSLVFVMLSSIFKQAESDELVTRSPMRGMKAPKPDTKERDALSPDEVSQVLDEIDRRELDGFLVAVAVMLALGLRCGEACGLAVADIDGETVHVRRRLDNDGKTYDTKTPSGVRSLPMPPRLRATLTRWMRGRIAAGIGDAEMLCCDWQGNPIRPQRLRNWWTKNRDGLGCAGMVLHQLRHSNLSMMARHMPSAFDLQRWAGWSSLEPARVYIHADRDALKMAVQSAFGYIPVTHAETEQSAPASTSGFSVIGNETL